MNKRFLKLGLVGALLVLSFGVFALPVQAGRQCFVGHRVDAVYEQGEWHNFVEFNVSSLGVSRNYSWTVSGPYWPTVWPGYYNGLNKRAGFRAPWKLAKYYTDSRWWTLCASW